MDGYLGTISIVAFNFAPKNYATCSGQIMDVSQNTALFSLLSNIYGGDGRTTFGLPNLKGRVAVSQGQSPGGYNRSLGQTFGSDIMTLNDNNLPAHTHSVHENQADQTVTIGSSTASIKASTTQATKNKPTGNYWAKGRDEADATVVTNYADSHDTTMASDAVEVTMAASFNAANLTTGITGNGQGFPVDQPSLTLNYCICTQGMYPSRS